MASIILKKHSNPEQISEKDLFNTTTPFSYRDWLQNHVGIIPSNSESQYQKYLDEWYHTKQTKENYSDNKIKEDYISLLKRLTVIFKNDEEFNRIAAIDFDSTTDLALAIPHFARKLKEIAIYYINKRESLKRTKLKYNMVGSPNALERILYEHLLNAFTKKDKGFTVTTKELYNNIPALSSIQNDFHIEVEELYDMTDYFDPKLAKENNTVGYYELSTTNPLLFVLEEYIFNVYNAFDLSEVPLSGLANPLSEFVVYETDRSINEQYLAELGQKYIGNDIYFLTGGYYDLEKRAVSLDFSKGNNFFYWFSGEYVRERPEGIFDNLPLSAIDWTVATGNSAYNVSDIVFVWAGNRYLEGAWLMKSNFITVNDTMQSTIKDGFQFKFPYPGIGISAEGGDWTGKTLRDTENIDRRFFPSESEFLNSQEKITDLYWTATSSISTCIEINLQDTTLYDSGAFASTTFNKADKIIVRREVGEDRLHDINPNEIFNGILETSWLFHFNQTELEIHKGVNSIYYPLTAYDKPENLFFRYDTGNDVALSSLAVGSSFAGAVAGNKLEESDFLIKLNSICGPELEGAWLRGTPLSAYSAGNVDKCSCDGDFLQYYTNWKFTKGTTQPALSYQCLPGNFVRFVWTGPQTSLNSIEGFTGFDHDDACEYKKFNKYYSLLDANFLSLKNKSLYERWKTCTCKSLHHTPTGHTHDDFLHYKFPTDFIARDQAYPSAFSFNTWRGQDGLDYKTSTDIAWFKANSLLEPDVGWGKGEWQANFELEPGKTYIYYRSDLNRCGFDLPYFLINHGYCECDVGKCEEINCLPRWTKAILNDEGVWEDTGLISDMVMDSGRFFKYLHKDSYGFAKDILTYDGNIINSISGDYIQLSGVDTKVDYKEVTTAIPAINFLIKIPLEDNKPYWGEASWEDDSRTQNKREMWGDNDVRITHGYLQIHQPLPSRTVLHDNDVVEYKLSECNDCFIWDQPMEFKIQEDALRWNKIFIDTCVKSDILNYLHERTCDPCDITTKKCYSECQEDNICGCENLCYITKTGVTASFIPSEIILNTELSGIPVFVDYYARNPFTLEFNVVDRTNGGTWVPPISTIYAKAQKPWANIINDFYPTVAGEISASLFNRKQLGTFIPKNLATGRYELKKGEFKLNSENRNSESYDLVRNNNYADGDIQVNSWDASWMKYKQGTQFAGNIKINGNQSYYPYTNNQEFYKNNQWGLTTELDEFSPFDSKGKWKNIEDFPANYRNLYPINCGPNAWYNNQLNLSGNVIEWQTDIYGNQFFLMNDTGTKLSPSSAYNTLFLKKADKTIVSHTDLMELLFLKYKNVNIST